ncbi:riboflavin synthase, alpha subunit [Luminiphilus syltensis NOR5-1B]|uniref:Riboflavin synthase n=1 Tax=Luminiphilus syltensis NOR5-1B TaxID=565045 RepID=B8KWB0_9GAMM|nr:riboflavin synthase [Luminiphilus syltensis]EED35019.1 riboflavin synthase, alpha subunit [Luminiphilus syltensis NOR5-1B]
MFTGIIEAVGEIAAMEPRGGDLRLRIRTGKLDLSDVQLGDSICTSGTCLTVTELPGDGYWADVSVETLNFTTLGDKKPGNRVNLERSLTPASRLGGHIVSGHVDGVGEVVAVDQDARSWRYSVEAPPDLARYIAHKGSICVDGTSLTVNAVHGGRFELNIIPQTLQETVFGEYQPGSRVNLEVDVIARYLERLLMDRDTPVTQGLSLSSLKEAGYLNE